MGGKPGRFAKALGERRGGRERPTAARFRSSLPWKLADFPVEEIEEWELAGELGLLLLSFGMELARGRLGQDAAGSGGGQADGK